MGLLLGEKRGRIQLIGEVLQAIKNAKDTKYEGLGPSAIVYECRIAWTHIGEIVKRMIKAGLIRKLDDRKIYVITDEGEKYWKRYHPLISLIEKYEKEMME